MSTGQADVLEISIRSSYDALDEVVALVEDVARRLELGEDDETDLMISVMEAVNNAIQHGNQGDESKEVHLRLETSEGTVTIWVRDEGTGFDLDSVPDPTDPGNLMNVSGRGILMMKSFMDEVCFKQNAEGMVVRMAKRFVAA